MRGGRCTIGGTAGETQGRTRAAESSPEISRFPPDRRQEGGVPLSRAFEKSHEGDAAPKGGAKTFEKGNSSMNQTDRSTHIRNLVLAALFIAIGMVLPYFTGQIPQIGKMLSPMHLPVLLCGLICGWPWGLAVGLILPLFRHFTLGMPMLLDAVAMTFELATYGGVVGFLYRRFKKQNIAAVYCSLIAAMLAGRAVWGVVRVIMTGVTREPFTWQMFMAGGFINAVPAIILQLVFIPAIMAVLDRTGLVRFQGKHPEASSR